MSTMLPKDIVEQIKQEKTVILRVRLKKEKTEKAVEEKVEIKRLETERMIEKERENLRKGVVTALIEIVRFAKSREFRSVLENADHCRCSFCSDYSNSRDRGRFAFLEPKRHKGFLVHFVVKKHDPHVYCQEYGIRRPCFGVDEEFKISSDDGIEDLIRHFDIEILNKITQLKGRELLKNVKLGGNLGRGNHYPNI